MADPMAGLLGRPFAEQLAAFRLRMQDLRGTRAWDDLHGQEHDRAFMVAGAMKADLLADIARAVEKAIEGKSTLDGFRKDFRGIVEKLGWHGWTGEGTAKGEAWRTRVIYRTNMATTYAAGRHAQLTAGNYKYWVYHHGGSEHPRLHHLSWDGVALPPDHPFWASHYPPNGWGCSCYASGTNSKAGIRRLGGDPDKQLPPGWEAISPKTGAPTGIDKGWGHAPGRTVVTEILEAVGRKTKALPDPIGSDLISAIRDRLGTVTANPETPEVAINLGREVLDDLLEAVLPDDFALLSARGQPVRYLLEEGFHDLAADELRGRIMASLKGKREIGTEQIALGPGTSRNATAIMRKVAAVMPAEWVRLGNQTPVSVRVTQKRGSYRPGPLPVINTDDSSTAVHEYLHHLQFKVDGLDDLFQQLHRSRTEAEPLIEIYGPREIGRPDGYYEPYQGREYARSPGQAYEVLTMGLQPVLGEDRTARDFLARMLKKDREMLEFILGVLFYWKPKGLS